MEIEESDIILQQLHDNENVYKINIEQSFFVLLLNRLADHTGIVAIEIAKPLWTVWDLYDSDAGQGWWGPQSAPHVSASWHVTRYSI